MKAPYGGKEKEYTEVKGNEVLTGAGLGTGG